MLAKKLYKLSLCLGHHEIPTLQYWVLAFDFQQKLRTQNLGVLHWVKKNPTFFYCYVEIFLYTKKDIEEILQSLQQSRIF